MSDLICRKALLEDFRKSISESSDTLDWINLINRQPTADTWIPITERLPKSIGELEYEILHNHIALIERDLHKTEKECDYWHREAIKSTAKLGEIRIWMGSLGFSKEIIQEYKKFEDELVAKGFTFNNLIEAREKQMPKEALEIRKKHDFNGNVIIKDGYCPACKQELSNAYHYCNKCGQAIRWED